jgi:hypothetical protein
MTVMNLASVNAQRTKYTTDNLNIFTNIHIFAYRQKQNCRFFYSLCLSALAILRHYGVVKAAKYYLNLFRIFFYFAASNAETNRPYSVIAGAGAQLTGKAFFIFACGLNIADTIYIYKKSI